VKEAAEVGGEFFGGFAIELFDGGADIAQKKNGFKGYKYQK